MELLSYIDHKAADDYDTFTEVSIIPEMVLIILQKNLSTVLSYLPSGPSSVFIVIH